MDLFKKENIKYATCIDWNCPIISKRQAKDTQRLHKHSRRKLKKQLRQDLQKEGLL